MLCYRMLKLFWTKENYQIRKKIPWWFQANSFYTKEHQGNLDFIRGIDEKIAYARRENSFDTSRQDDEKVVNINFLLDLFDLKWEELTEMFNNYKQSQSILKKFRKDGEDEKYATFFLPSYMSNDSREVKKSSIDISSYSKLNDLLDFFYYKKTAVFLKKNRLEYSHYLGKYICPIYSWFLLKQIPGLSDKDITLDDKAIDEIIDLLPKNVEVERKEELLCEYPLESHSFLEITLQDWVKIHFVKALMGDILFYAVEVFSKEVYSFFRALHINYICSFNKFYSDTILSFLDFWIFDLKKLDIASISKKVREYREFISVRNSFLVLHWRTEDEIEKSMKKHTSIFNGLGYKNILDMWWRQEYILGLWGNCEPSILTLVDRAHLKEKDNINWCKYKLDMDASWEVFIDSLKEYIRESDRNTLIDWVNIIPVQKYPELVEEVFNCIWFDWSAISKNKEQMQNLKNELEVFFHFDFSQKSNFESEESKLDIKSFYGIFVEAICENYY